MDDGFATDGMQLVHFHWFLEVYYFIMGFGKTIKTFFFRSRGVRQGRLAVGVPSSPTNPDLI